MAYRRVISVDDLVRFAVDRDNLDGVRAWRSSFRWHEAGAERVPCGSNASNLPMLIFTATSC